MNDLTHASAQQKCKRQHVCIGLPPEHHALARRMMQSMLSLKLMETRGELEHYGKMITDLSLNTIVK